MPNDLIPCSGESPIMPADMPTPVHLFVLCPPASGSTLLWKLLQTSANVSALPGEGQALVADRLRTPDRWDPDKAIDWQPIRAEWERHWLPDQAVRLEKSPPHLIRARQLQEEFPDSRFIVMIRNPYAFCEGVHRRWGRPGRYFADFSYADLAEFWLFCASWQLRNLAELGHTCFISYEEMCDDPEPASKKILNLVPELDALHPDRKFDVFERSFGITNLNESQIASLAASDIRQINSVLKDEEKIMNRFSYPFLEQ
jgi:hypothetical protein